jgi:RNA polymerase sigma factor (sigma-70 family)
LPHEHRFTPGPESPISPFLPVNLTDAELDSLFSSCLPSLSRAASRMIRNAQDSEDALQDGLLSAFQNLHQFQGRSKFSTWLHSIVRNAAKMHLRASGSRVFCSLEQQLSGENESRLENLVPDFHPDPEQIAMRRERSRILRSALNELPPRYQSVIQLCDIEGMEGKDAAAALGISLNSLKTSLHRARRLVSRKIGRRFLSRQHYAPDAPKLEMCPPRQPNLRPGPALHRGKRHPRAKSKAIHATPQKNWNFAPISLAPVVASLPKKRVA